jgi:hypothetical protein
VEALLQSGDLLPGEAVDGGHRVALPHAGGGCCGGGGSRRTLLLRVAGSAASCVRQAALPVAAATRCPSCQEDDRPTFVAVRACGCSQLQIESLSRLPRVRRAAAKPLRLSSPRCAATLRERLPRSPFPREALRRARAAADEGERGGEAARSPGRRRTCSCRSPTPIRQGPGLRAYAGLAAGLRALALAQARADPLIAPELAFSQDPVCTFCNPRRCASTSALAFL